MKNPDISQFVWNDNDSDTFSNETYYHLLMSQYKIYMEISDRTYVRRSIFNVFFLTLHAIIIATLGVTLSKTPYVPQIGLLVLTLLGLLILCYAWWRVVQYYRHLSEAKKCVLGELENRLPSSPSLRGESKALNQDNPYNQLKKMECILPFSFAILYLLSFGYMAYISW